ncbi:MAG: hypothetical protein ACLQVD_16305 [Capsulimonadaceae bacterium]
MRHIRILSGAGAIVAGLCCLAPASAHVPKGYKGTPFHDSVYPSVNPGGPQTIPGKVQCAYYDFGGEGVAYHDVTSVNQGSGRLNKDDGTYLNEFRMNEGVDISYVKNHDQVDNNPFNLVQPPDNQLYVGWTDPGEWFNITVDVQKAGKYTVDLLYTSHQGGTISLDRNFKDMTGPLTIVSTFNKDETVPWRNWHHWNLAKNLATVDLPEGESVITVHILTEGNFNLAYFDFEPAQY